MELNVRLMDIDAGGLAVVVLNSHDAKELGIRPLDRVNISGDSNDITAIADISATCCDINQIGVYTRVQKVLDVKDNDTVQVRPGARPKSLEHIRHKLNGHRLDKNQIQEIIYDVVHYNLTDIELSAFITSLHTYGLSMEEVEWLTRSMVETGEKLNLGVKKIYDKHSVGGGVGDKTSLVLVPLIAACGLTIPKTSSRAITSCAGTADRMEVLTNVHLDIEEIERVVKKTNGCLVWGGALRLSPADDIFIRVEYPLSIDPLLLPSVTSKKMAIGATNVVIDIPMGAGTKITSISEAHSLAREFIELGRRMDIKFVSTISSASQPFGYAIGPALEAKEALETLMGQGPPDVISKVINISSVLLKEANIENPLAVAEETLKSKKALNKMRQIIEEQGGDPKIMPDDIPKAKNEVTIYSEHDGRVYWISNRRLVKIARFAGAPNSKTAGVLTSVKLNSKVKKGDKLFTIYSDSTFKLAEAEKVVATEPIGVRKSWSDTIIIDEIQQKEERDETRFDLDRG